MCVCVCVCVCVWCTCLGKIGRRRWNARISTREPMKQLKQRIMTAIGIERHCSSRNKSSQGPAGFLSEEEADKKITMFSLHGSVHHEAVN